MRLANDLDGKPIISVSDGRIVGRAKGVYIDHDLQWLAGVDLGTEGLLRRKKVIIVRDDVVLFGLDVILVREADVVTDNKSFAAAKTWLRPKQISGREVITPGGTRIGTVGDVLFDEDGRVGGFTLSRVFVEGPLARKRLVLREAVLEPDDLEGNVTVDLLHLEALLAGREASLRDADESLPSAKDEQPPELAESQDEERPSDDETADSGMDAETAAGEAEGAPPVAEMDEPYPAATMATKPEEAPLAVSDSEVVAEPSTEASEEAADEEPQSEAPPEQTAENEAAAPEGDEDEAARE